MGVLKKGIFINMAFIAILIKTAMVTAEPHCSKFPYEEALLEKMIRMEIKVEQMEKKILAAKDQVLSEAEKLNEHRNKLEEFSRDIVQDIKNRDNNAERAMVEFQETLNEEFAEKTRRMEDVFQQKEAKITRLSDDLMSLKNNTVNQLKGGPNTPVTPVYFMAKISSKFSYSTNEVFLFDTVLNKEGDQYHPSNGIFTTPSDGIYLFTVQFCTGPRDTVEFGFEVNRKTEQVSLMYPSTDTCETNSFIKNLVSGSRVRVKNTSSNKLKNDSWRWNIFSGVLITSL